MATRTSCDTGTFPRITSLAFNLTGVDVTPDMGPFEVALGTQWEDGCGWNTEMFASKRPMAKICRFGCTQVSADGSYLLSLGDDHAALPNSDGDHQVCRVVDELVPVIQKHDIEGSVMGAD